MSQSISYFVKFFDTEAHADSFLKGKLFSNRFLHFKKIETQDSLTNNSHLLINNEHSAPIKKHWQKYINVFCIFAGRHGELEIPEECQKLGKFAVIISNIGEFLERVQANIRSNDYFMTRDFVEYYDSTIPHLNHESIFRKGHEFGYQREYRFAISTGISGTEPVIFNIGDISDISKKCNNFVEIKSRINTMQHA